MDPREVDALVQRLVANPHDQEVLAYAHQAGASDPRSYAALLERVGMQTHDPAYASHWLSEAANVYSTTLGDAHHAAEVLMLAVQKDPTQDLAADRLAQLYRDKGDVKGLVALLEKRAKLLSSLAGQDADLAQKVAAMHEELGTLWSEPPLSQPRRALDNFKRAYETDPRSVFAIYSARELFKQLQQYSDAIPLFAMEQQQVTDPERKLALFRDEAAVRKAAGDLAGAVETFRAARGYAPEDYSLVQEQASAILDRVQAKEPVPQSERDEGAELFAALAEAYDGEHGFAYSTAALDLMPGHDRAVQLATHYAGQLGRAGEMASRWGRYLAANPHGAMAADVRRELMGVEQAAGPDQAIAALEAARGDPAVDAKLQDLYQRTGRTEQAVAHIEQQAADLPNAERVAKLLEAASLLASKRQGKEALAKYMEVLHLDPVSPEALAWVDEHLRSKRQYPELRDVYQAAARAPSIGQDLRKKYLSNVANICEQQLRDFDGAIQALKQLSQIDSGARENLRRLLEKGQRWDDLAMLLDQEVSEAPDQEAQIALLKKLAALHEQKRKDLVAAGEAWSRMATLLAGDDGPILSAVKLFDKVGRLDLAAQVIADNYAAVDGNDVRVALLTRLGELREKIEDLSGAGDAWAEAADLGAGAKAWEAARRCFEGSERWEDAARAIGELAGLAKDPKEQARLRSLEADCLMRTGDQASAILRLEQAADIDPGSDTYAATLEERYQETERVDDLVAFLLRRADKLPDRDRRVALRKRAADTQRNRMSDADAARDTLMRVLEDGDDAESLALLAEDARGRGEFSEEVALLHRLAAATADPAARLEILLREAAVLADDLNDPEAAIARHEEILQSLDPKSQLSLAAIADLEERRENPKGAAAALERQLALVSEKELRVGIAQRLAGLYGTTLDDPRGAIRALEVVHAEDPDDFEAISRLVELCEGAERWERTAELIAKLLEVEGDQAEASELSRRLSRIMHERLDKGQEALGVLEGLADEGDEPCREQYVELGDALGFKGIVALKLREWYGLSSAAKQHDAFRGAFERFLEMGRDADAAQTAVDLIRSKGATPDIVKRLEEIAVRLKDLDSLGAAHDMMVRELSGAERADEYVRQAEMQVHAGVDPTEAVQHGEQGLTSVPPAEVEPLLERLGRILAAPGHVIDLYERQVGRCKSPNDRLLALARAAQIAADKGALDRAQSLFELALGGGVREETLEVLERAAADADEARGGLRLRETLASALASGSHGLRDGGRTRSALLRRAATIAYRDLGDASKAFGWLGEALTTHVEAPTLDALEELGETAGDLKKVEAIISKSLEEVFDGPLVRQLVARRAKLRRDRLEDKQGAAQDLKKLHDLSPTDAAITDELYALLTELRDWRSMVSLLEDQILRGKDPQVRAELARKAAQLWEERLADPRESADAWRRVLRMKPGDTEAQAGLDRAKANMLKKPESIPPPADDDAEAQGPKTTPSAPPVAAAPTSQPSVAEPAAPPPKPQSQPGHAPSSEPPLDTERFSAGQVATGRATPPPKSKRPDISFATPGDDEPTLSAPASQPAPTITDRVQRYDELSTATAPGGYPKYAQAEAVEALDDAESVGDDELLDIEPSPPPPAGAPNLPPSKPPPPLKK